LRDGNSAKLLYYLLIEGTILNTSRQHRGAIIGSRTCSETICQSLNFVGLNIDIDQLIVVRPGDHKLDRVGAEGGKRLVETRVVDAVVVSWGQIRFIAAAEVHAPHRHDAGKQVH